MVREDRTGTGIERRRAPQREERERSGARMGSAVVGAKANIFDDGGETEKEKEIGDVG